MTPDTLNERLALALGWKPHPTLFSTWIPPGRDISQGGYYRKSFPDYLSGDGMLAVLEALKQQPGAFGRFEDLVFFEMDWGAGDEPAALVGAVLWQLTPQLVAECALKALERVQDAI